MNTLKAFHQEFDCKPGEDKNRRKDKDEMSQAIIHGGSAEKHIGKEDNEPKQNKRK
jgi:hypothetical protein